jgi:hypothetical protein
MSNPEKDKNVQDETTILHLDKFGPSSPSQPPAVPSAEEGMTVFIQRAAAETVQNSKDPIIVPKDAQGLAAQEMLGAVSYAYAKDVFESDRIEQKMLQNPELREKLGDNVPDAQSISKFRKLNRGAIMRTIEKAFRLKRRKEKEELMKPLPGQPATAVPLPPQDGENTVMFSKQQAEQKIENAIIIDNMSRDQ